MPAFLPASRGRKRIPYRWYKCCTPLRPGFFCGSSRSPDGYLLACNQAWPRQILLQHSAFLLLSARIPDHCKVLGDRKHRDLLGSGGRGVCGTGCRKRCGAFLFINGRGFLSPAFDRILDRSSLWMPSNIMFSRIIFREEKVLKDFEDVVAHNKLVYNELVDQRPRLILYKQVVGLTADSKIKSHGERSRHDDIALVKLRHRYIKSFAGVCLRGIKSDALHRALGFHCTEILLIVRWSEVCLHSHGVYKIGKKSIYTMAEGGYDIIQGEWKPRPLR